MIPCFNEARTIARLAATVRQYLPLVIVVDDGSTDGTPALAQDAGARVVGHRRNLGKGAALRTGLSLALKQGFEWALTLDGDGQHAPDDLPNFLRCAEETKARLIIGDRMHNMRAIPWLRRHVNRWVSRQLSRRTVRHLPDTQCGFRLIHLGTWAALPLKTKRFEVESETLMAFLAAGCQVEFVPIQVIRSGRSSHIQPLADSVRWLKWWWNFSPNSAWSDSVNSVIQATLPASTQTEMPHQEIMADSPPAHLLGFQTYFPLGSIYPNRPPALTLAKPSEKEPASSNCGLITNFPVGSMNPQCFD